MSQGKSESPILQYQYFYISKKSIIIIIKGNEVHSSVFAERLKRLRRSRELNQVQLAQKLGVQKQSISNWENDNIMPSVERLERAADFFGVTTDYLLGREKKTESRFLLDVSGLRQREIDHIRQLIEDLRRQ